MPFLLAFAIGVATSTPLSAQTINQALDQQGNPEQLRFLRDFRFQPRLRDAIVGDLQSLPSERARETILDRLRSDQASVGALPDRVLNSVLRPQAGLAPSLNELRERARDRSQPDSNPALVAALPDIDVLRIEKLRQLSYIVRPFTPTPLNADPSTIPAGLATSERRTPQILWPYRRQKLTAEQCTPSVTRVRTMACSYPGASDCPSFDPSRFAGVAEVTFGSDGGVCTGTSIAQSWLVTAAHCFLGPGLSSPTLTTEQAVSAPGSEGARFGQYRSLSVARFVNERDGSVYFSAFPASSFRVRKILAVVTHPNYRPIGNELPEDGPLADIALVHFETEPGLDAALAKMDAHPASIPKFSYSGSITLLGHGKTDNSEQASPSANLTWPEADVQAVSGRLTIMKPTVRTFCVGDSGGPALAGLQRGCPVPPEQNPVTLVGVISYHSGAALDADGCRTSAVSAFTDVADPVTRAFICGVTSNAVGGCP